MRSDRQRMARQRSRQMSRNRRALPFQSQPTSLDRKNPRHLLRGHLRPGRGIVESPDSRDERHGGEAAFSASLRLAPSLHIRLSRSPCAIARVFILLPSYFILFFIRCQSKIQHSKSNIERLRRLLLHQPRQRPRTPRHHPHRTASLGRVREKRLPSPHFRSRSHLRTATAGCF